MVTFFNKKEEVIDLQLTEYGKYLFSLGIFSPEYYAFFDDDILYDSKFGLGYVERQNDIEERIKNETPSLKVIPTITGAETRVGEFTNNLLNAYDVNPNIPSNSSDIAQFFNQQPFSEKVDILGTPLGNSSLASKNAPSWSIYAHHNDLSASVYPTEGGQPGSNTYISRNESIAGPTTTDVGGPVQQIPQINIDIDYHLYAKSGEIVPSVAVSPYINSNIYLAIKKNYLVLEVLEENTEYMKENFDIEVFYSGSSDPAAATEALQTMSFFDYSADDGNAPQVQEIGNESNMVPNVDYYLNILVDDQIPNVYMAETNSSFVTRNSQRLPLRRDIYQTEDEDPC